MRTTRSGVEYILKCLACRDVWHSEEPLKQPRSIGFAGFHAWVIQAYNRSDPPQAVTELMALLVHPNDHTGYTTNQLAEKLRERKNGREFRVALSSDVDEENDFRVRHFLEALVSDPRQNTPFTMSALHCQFYGDRKSIQTPRKKFKGTFGTQPCTRFEQLWFLAGVARLSFVLQARRSVSVLAKRRRDSNEARMSLPNIPTLKGLSGEQSQRVGFAIQKVVRGWDTLSRHLGFRDTEDMAKPYIRVKGNPVLFEVVKSRDEGFVPRSQEKQFSFDVELTVVKDETYADAFDRSAEVDQMLRQMLTEFINDVYSVIECDGLYSHTEQWEHLDEYDLRTGEELPKRFSRMSKALLTGIAYGMNRTAPNVETVSSEKTTSAPTAPQTIIANQDRSPSPVLTDEEFKKNMETLEESVHKYLRLINCSFEEVIDLHDHLFSREQLEGGVQLVLMDPPYNIRRLRGDDNSSHDELTEEEMDEAVEVCARLLRPGGHLVIFCSWQQLTDWEKRLRGHGETSKLTFRVSPPIVLAWHPSVSHAFPGRRFRTLQNSAEFAVHVKKNGLKGEQEEEMVNFMNHNYVASDYPAHKNVINNIKGLLPGEQMRVKRPDDQKSSALRPEQKPIALLKQLISQYSQPGDLVVDLFGGTYSTGMACMDLEKHRRFVGCELDEGCHEFASNHLLRRLATAVAEKRTDLKLSADGVHSAWEIHSKYKVKRIQDKRWTAPNGLPATQAMPEHIVAHLATLSGDVEFFLNNKDKPVHEWPRMMQGVLQQMDSAILRGVDAIGCGVIIAPSKIRHKNAGLGVFAAKSFHPGKVIGGFYGCLVYHNLHKRKNPMKTYGNGVLGTTVKRFKRFAIQVPVDPQAFQKVTELMDGKKAVSVVPAPFCACGYINDVRYLKDDEEREAVQAGTITKREVNVIFASERFPVRASKGLIPPYTQLVEAKCYINPGEELYVDYGYGADCSSLELEP